VSGPFDRVTESWLYGMTAEEHRRDGQGHSVASVASKNSTADVLRNYITTKTNA
jgi:hypothetical protein